MLAVAERRLGDGVIDRARALLAIRHELDKLDRYVVLHLLGTATRSYCFVLGDGRGQL